MQYFCNNGFFFIGWCVGKDEERIGHNPRVSVRIYIYFSYNFVTRNVQLLKHGISEIRRGASFSCVHY